MSVLSGRCVVLGVTGSIAAYKAVEVCNRLVDSGAHVIPVLTKSATRMIGLATFSALASEPAKTSLWHDLRTPIPHIVVGRKADLILVCPATARLISDLRTGRSADILTATISASRAPLLLVPAMHTEMWEQPAVQENISVLVERGASVVWPVEGRLAGGDMGLGRMADPSVVLAAVEKELSPRDFQGRRILVTAGGTSEPIDAVRFIGNRSSGKQGCAIAAAAHARGADVELVVTRNAQAHIPSGVQVTTVETASEMLAAVQTKAPAADVVVMAAAVADFRPRASYTGKLSKNTGIPKLELEATEDILIVLGSQRKPSQILVGFAAETEDIEVKARRKLEDKQLQVIVANDVSKDQVGFDHETNEVLIITSTGDRSHVPLTSKNEIARSVLDVVAGMMSKAGM